VATAHFTDGELGCKHCGQLPPQWFQDRLEALRVAYGKPMRLSSGYRCPEYNVKVSGTGSRGPHTQCAVDIQCYGGEALAILRLALQHEFAGIGVSQKGPVGSRFLHLDDVDDAEHPRPWVWSY
jgi:zinc D-Ala-D-Ala carboxypeptidase